MPCNSWCVKHQFTNALRSIHDCQRQSIHSLLHMTFYLYLFLGFLGGIPAGMGMGGGTVTIPLLVLVGGVEQKIAQCANLFSFFPMSLAALKTHADNGLVETQGLWWGVIPALALSALGAWSASVLPSALLQKGFGLFLIFLAFLTAYRGLNSQKN